MLHNMESTLKAAIALGKANRPSDDHVSFKGAHLEGANLFIAHLYGADLEGANLRSARLQYANLEGANLRSARLQYANLNYADLNYANLRGANLRGANLYRANLNYADLRGANLYRANLYRANLEHADLRGADLCNAKLEYANLRGAKIGGAKIVGAKGVAVALVGDFFVLAYVNENKIRVQAGCRNMEINDFRDYVRNAEKHVGIRGVALAYFGAFEMQLNYLIRSAK